MITSNGDMIDREPERGDLYVNHDPYPAPAIIRRLTRCGKKTISLQSPFHIHNRYGYNQRRRSFDYLVDMGYWKLRVPQPDDIISGSFGGKCRVIEATTRLATAIDENDEKHWFPIADLSLTKIYLDNQAYWHWGGQADDSGAAG
jgi:hypothetical protein